MPSSRTKAAKRPVSPPTDGGRLPMDEAALALRQFRLIFNAVRSHFKLVERATGLGGSQAWALSVVREHPGLGISDLARSMDVHQSTASNLVRMLVARGLLATARNDADRRNVQLKLLPEGERLLCKAPALPSGVLPRALSSLDAATLTRLNADLAAVLKELKPDARAARTPLADL
jgi:DNA-binding MarR family transcriptional regulator